MTGAGFRQLGAAVGEEVDAVGAALALVASSSVSRPTLGIPRARL
jgi:hypothetical protein